MQGQLWARNQSESVDAIAFQTYGGLPDGQGLCSDGCKETTAARDTKAQESRSIFLNSVPFAVVLAIGFG